MPKVTVIIPNYNYAHYLGKAVDSVLSQSFTDLSILVVDNFSTDNSEAVVSRREDSRASFHQFGNDGVIARSRNFGLALAESEFVAFLDSDDFWFPHKLARQLERMTLDDFASYHDMRIVPSVVPRKVKGFSTGAKPLEKMLIYGNPIPLSSVICRREALLDLGGFAEDGELVGVEDYATWLRAAERGLNFKRVALTLGAYRKHDSMSSSLDLASKSDRLVQSYAAKLNPSQRTKSRASYFYGKATVARNRNLSKEEMQYLFRCLRCGNLKFAWRALVRLIFRLVRVTGDVIRFGTLGGGK